MKFRNPIIPGYSPDPSICRVGDDYYLVNSTFEFFPGVPVYHSTNLVDWECIGHVLDREEQLHLNGCRNSGGIYAPTIRYYEGKFYMITTNVTDRGNFVVHADQPQGPWSNPAWIDQGGIDPSLFWDEEGTCYYCSTGTLDGVRGIVGFIINPITGEILSDKKIISTGCGGQCTEGPHVYKKDGWYYLLTAEGGTEYGHRAAMGRSRSFWGPYESCPGGQIMSHRERKAHEIQATGHADFVEDQNGNWWAVFLAFRNFSHALLHNLGRETYLSPVTWREDGWPEIGSHGYVELEMEGPLPGGEPKPWNHSMTVDFKKPIRDYNVMFTRNPIWEDYSQNKQDGVLTLHGTDVTIDQPGASPTIISLRQPDFETEISVTLDVLKSHGMRAGLSAYYNNDYHYDIYLKEADGKKMVGFYKHVHDMGVVIKEEELQDDAGTVEFKIRSDRDRYEFYYRVSGEGEYRFVGSGLNAGLSTEGTSTMTFTGTLFAVFAEGGDGVFLDRIEMVH